MRILARNSLVAKLLRANLSIILSALLLAGVSTSGIAAPTGVAIVNKDFGFSLKTPEGYKLSSPPKGSLSLYYFRGGRGTASVSKFESANRRAFQRSSREAFFEQIERGLVKSGNQVRVSRRRAWHIGRLPALDLDWIRTSSSGGRQRVFARFLFRYRYTLVAIISIPIDSPKSRARFARNFRDSLRFVAPK